MKLLRLLCLALALPSGRAIPAAGALLQPLSAGAAAAVGAGLTAAWAAYTTATEQGASPFAAAGTAALDTARRAALAAGETAVSAHAAASKALDMAVAKSALDNLGKILEDLGGAMGKKAELEARDVFSNPDNPLNPEVLQQRARVLQEGFEEQIKSASGGMLDLGDWRRSLEEGLTAGAAIDWLKERNQDLENVGVPGAEDRKWVLEQIEAMARLTGNGPKSSTINIDDGVPADIPTEIDISFDEADEETSNIEIDIEEQPTPPSAESIEIDIGAAPAEHLVASDSSSADLGAAAIVGAGAGFGMALGAFAAVLLFRRSDTSGDRRALARASVTPAGEAREAGEARAVEPVFSK